MELLIILGLVLLNGVFAMAEIATVSARKIRLAEAAKKGDKAARKVLDLSKDPGRFLSTVQIGITLIGILTGIYSGQKIEDDLARWLGQFPLLAPWSSRLATILLLIGLTWVSILIGELVPKRIGLANPETMARWLAFPMDFLSRATTPFIWLLTKSSDTLIKILGIRPNPNNKVTEEEIKALVREGRAAGAIREIEQQIVERVFNLGDRKVGSLMTHRSDAVSIPVDATREQVMAVVRGKIHTAYPVISKKSEIEGILYLKDLFAHLDDGMFDLHALLKPAFFVFENASAYETMKLFKTKKIQQGIIVDEFGVMQGLLTMNDLLEALIGETGEGAQPMYEFTRRSDGTILVDGQYPLPEFLMKTGLEKLITSLPYNTVSGLVLHELGHIPKVGDKVLWQDMNFEIMDMDGARIDKIMVSDTAQN